MVRTRRKIQAGSDINEDLVWIGETAAVVLDGATGLTDRQFSDAASDGKWYVDVLAQKIREALGEDASLATVARTAISDVASEYNALVDGEQVADHEVPSAAGAIVRWTDEEAEYLVLGDCSIVFSTSTGANTVFGEGPRELDDKVVEEMVDIQASEDDVDYTELRSRVDPMLVEHRKLKNEPEGYWTFGMDPDAVAQAQTGSLDRAAVDRVLSFTDGFEPIVPLYDAFDTWETLLTYIEQNGLDRAVRIQRAFEKSDPECKAYPRLKPADDIGIALINFDA